MPIKSEVLNKGLRNVIDPALATEGSLTRADNARYRPGDPAIWQAEGRRQIGPTGNHGSNAPITQVAGVQWDPGTVKESGKPELTQIIYRADTGSGLELRSIEALDDPTSLNMGAGTATTYSLPSDISMGSSPLRTVQFENDHFVLSGGHNVRLKRTAGGSQSAARHGLPDTSEISIYTNFTTSPVTTQIMEAGIHFYWFTWYDSVNDIEGGSEAPTIGAASSSNIWKQGYRVLTSDLPVGSNQATQLAWLQDDFDQPVSVDKIRIYKSVVRTTDVPAVGETPSFSAWPIGYRIAEIAVSSLTSTNTRISIDPIVDKAIYTWTYDHGKEPTLSENVGFEPYIITVGGGVPTNSALRGEPPKSTTGDVLEESLILNDINDPRKMRFSYPGEPLAFPVTNFLNFETDKSDEVKNIKTLGNVAGVFLGNTIWRVNWLPVQTDFDFGRGRVKDVVSETIGTLGPASVARFDWPGKGPSLATVDRTGVYVTDLYSTKELSEHLDWDAVVATGHINSSTALVNNSDQRRLELYVGDEIYYFHYDDAHRDERGELAVTGPITRSGGVGGVAEIVTNVGTKRTLTCDTNGTPFSMYYEGMGFLEEAENIAGEPTTNSYLAFNVVTREVYPFGPGNEGRTQKLMAHIKPSGQGGNIVAHLTTGFGNPTITKTSKPIPASTRQLILATMMALHEYYKVQFSGVIDESGAAMAINFISVQAEGLGETQSSRF